MGDTVGVYYVLERAIEEDTLEAIIEHLRCDFDVQYSREERIDEDVSAVVDELLAGNGILRLDSPDLSMALFVNDTGVGPAPPNLVLDVDELYFRPDSLRDWDDRDVVDAVTSVCEIAIDLYEILVRLGTPPQYVLGTDIVDREFLTLSASTLSAERSALLGDGIRQLFWFQIVPPEIVDLTNEELLESIPAWNVERLVNGAVSIVCHHSPAPAPEMEDDHSTEAAREHFGFDVGL